MFIMSITSWPEKCKPVAMELFFTLFPFFFFWSLPKRNHSMRLVIGVGAKRLCIWYAQLGSSEWPRWGMGGDLPSSLPGSVSRETQSICLLYIPIFLLLQIFPLIHDLVILLCVPLVTYPVAMFCFFFHGYNCHKVVIYIYVLPVFFLASSLWSPSLSHVAGLFIPVHVVDRF